MESRVFIREATNIIRDIESAEPGSEDKIQKKINQLFSELTNPTLPSAYKLRKVALTYGYHIDPRVSQRLDQHDIIWG